MDLVLRNARPFGHEHETPVDVAIDKGRIAAIAPALAADGPAIALVRPEAVSLASGHAAATGPLVGTVIATSFLGATSRITVDLGDVTVLAQLPTSEAAAHPTGTRVQLAIRSDPVLIAPDEASTARA